MYLCNLKIRNFRNFRKANIDLKSEDNILIGENGCGKTNLLSAIRLVLDYTYRLENYLNLGDFNKKINYKNFGEWIIISAKFTDFNEIESGIGIHDFCLDEKKDSYINFFFKPKEKVLDSIYNKYQEYLKSEDNLKQSIYDELKDMIKEMSVENDYEVYRSFKQPFDFLNDETYYSVIGDYEKLNFDNQNYKNKNYIGIDDKVVNALKQINVTYIPPIRDVRENLASANGMFAKLINDSYEQISDENKNIISDKIYELNNQIAEIQEFDNLKKDMHNKMDIVGKNYFDSNFQIESKISSNKKEIVKNLELKIFDYDDIVDIWRKSLGEANVIYFALKLLESEKKKKSFRSTLLDLLLIEEPEAHIHGHLQKTLFRNLEENYSRQLIISTHSVNISEVCKISKMLILNNNYMETIVNNPSNGMTPKEIRTVERYLDANRSMLLFSKNVLMVEGDAENIVLPWLVKKLYGITLDEMGISIINVNSTFFDSLLPLFNENRITKRCAVITDLDKDYTSDGSKKDAEKKGLTRQKNINKLSEQNIYVKGFYAENTFEIQLFEIDSNLSILKDMVFKEDIIYKQNHTKTEKINRLNDDNSKKETIIEIVEYKGKGWFALELIDYCENHDLILSIPEYIIDAVNYLIVQKNNIKLVILILMHLLKDKTEIIKKFEKINNFNDLLILIKDIDNDSYILESIIKEVDNIE